MKDLSWKPTELMGVVQAIQIAKKNLVTWSEVSSEERFKIYSITQKILTENLDHFIEVESHESGISVDFLRSSIYRNLQKWLLDLLAKSQAQTLIDDKSKTKQFFASGTTVVLAPRFFSLKWVLQNILPGIYAGNCLIVKPSSRFKQTAMGLQKILNLIAAELPAGVLQVVQGSAEEVGHTLAMHPSIRNIIAVGNADRMNQLVKNLDLSRKKIQIYSGTSNSILLLNANIQEHQWDLLTKTMFLGFGQTGFNGQKIFVLESEQKSFQERLENWISSQWMAVPEAWFDFIERHERFLHEVRRQKGKVIGGHIKIENGQTFIQPALILDFTHCSEWQQEHLPACAVILSAVKYSHEMVKWSNLGDWGLAAQVWGEPEKARKIAAKLNVGVVWINTWIEQDLDFYIGAKSSYIGIADRHPFGSFWSECRNIVGSD